MARRRRLTTLLFLAAVMVLGFGGLGFRLTYLQVLHHPELAARARQNVERKFTFEPFRGEILDSKGNVLATSTFVRTVCADTVLLGKELTNVARAIAPLLDLSEPEILSRMVPRTNSSGKLLGARRMVLKEKVPAETWQEIERTMSKLDFGIEEKKPSQQPFYRELRKLGIYGEPVQMRVYPNKELAAHVLGYVGTEDVTVNGREFKQITGRDGIELTLNDRLRGVRGWRVTESTPRVRELVSFRDQDVEAQDGLSVVLTIDSVIQEIVEKELAVGMEKHTPISISGVVVRPRTGEILAMAVLPNFDPIDLGRSQPADRRNRIITDTCEPGSTFKIVPTSGALNEHLVSLEDVFVCERGRFYFAGHPLHDTEAHGLLSVERIIAKSSNIGAAKIAMKLGENRLYDYIRAFGFGKSTGIPLPGEVGGTVHPVKKWYKVSIAQIPMGHGLTVTPMQMIMAMSTIANQGVLMRPMVVNRLERRDHTVVVQYSPQRVQTVISEEAARKITTALKAVMADGTGTKAAPQNYTAAGKTGTAWKVENGAYVRKYFSSFIGFLPADNPEICIGVFMDEPKNGYYAAHSAGPVFKRIAEGIARYLSIPQDVSAEPTEGEKVAAASAASSLLKVGERTQ
jgi:cell division protein FtsI/penicillin-binding protein 2